MCNYWITPPGYLLTDTPGSKTEYISPGSVAEFLTAAGIRCCCIAAEAAPQIIRYDIRLADIFSYNPNKIKKALSALSARFHVKAELSGSNTGDFSVIVSRTPRADLYLKSVLYTEAWNDASLTSCAAGVDTENNPVIIDIKKAPHILIAGTTGSGKSVLLNSMIISLLYKATPADCQLLLIDPKKVELSAYKSLPHLSAPICTDAAEAVEVLKSVCDTMDSRYNMLQAAGYKSLEDSPEMFPRLYVVIDELADLMLTSRKAAETYIIRIAQLGRAAGVHLIIATQRPTTNIITGLIKANIPTKIALSVSNISDSITILNHGGAEKLTGRGDAIIKTPDTIYEKRLQAAFTPENDINRVCNYYKTYKEYHGL